MMLNNYCVPVLSKKDMDVEATKFLKRYCPEALERPMPVPVEEIAELKMNLDIDYVNIDEACETLGMMIFSDGLVEIYDRKREKYVLRTYKKGTLLVESDIGAKRNRGRERFTITHEMVHWHIHQFRFYLLGLIDPSLAKACRCPQERVHFLQTPEDWMEWQADNLAAAILMPAAMFRRKAAELFGKYRVGTRVNKYMWMGFSPGYINTLVIEELANTFQVSKQAAEIRVQTLGVRLLEA
ncbi:ImmA/IrrE family metallo-endopeptidase [Alkalibacter rhizosphaerae]|uniref:ImmA/IrrE family metallo-endopeptidase n=1 Tax=Alkalibacter rhizosphaerae TaxID=2815577 RepID=A0A975AJF8_9FIRM|nr:ImmA/IrrE family metallo-endopeptidase [Alkalibacter rhizosphaerae]QSX09565.1 ImmA/IrrE family metallo-endopeptidase [Alkalibacter rhizosphaerae]